MKNIYLYKKEKKRDKYRIEYKMIPEDAAIKPNRKHDEFCNWYLRI